MNKNATMPYAAYYQDCFHDPKIKRTWNSRGPLPARLSYVVAQVLILNF